MYLYLGLPCTRVRHMHALDMACYRGCKRTPRAPGTERPARWSRMQRRRNERGGDEGGGERSGTREGGRGRRGRRRPRPHPNPNPHPHTSRLPHAVADAATTPSSSAAAVAAPRSPPPPSALGRPLRRPLCRHRHCRMPPLVGRTGRSATAAASPTDEERRRP
jgi:hypothetical protein